MLRSTTAGRQKAAIRLPDGIYVGFVDSLLIEVRGLLLSGSAMILAGAISAIAARSIALWICTLFMAVILVIRWRFMHSHARNVPSATAAAARRRETIFLIGAVLFMFSLSLWTFVAFYVTDDGFTRFFTAAITIPYAFGMWTRSFAIDRGINIQIAAAFIPLSAAMLVAGGWYPSMIVVGFIPLFIFIKASSTKLKDTFRAEVGARIKSGVLANRLDAALNNMSHGMCMLSAQKRLLVSNAKFSEFLALDRVRPLSNVRFESLMRLVKRRGAVPQETIDELQRAFDAAAAGGRSRSLEFETANQSFYEVTITPNSTGGWVMVVQDNTAKRNADRLIDQMAHFDPVTELRNRRSFEIALFEALARSEEVSAPFDVMFLDLDDFKQVNDSLGHRTGDKLLAEIANRLRRIIGPNDLVARWGGDEFVILHYDEPGALPTACLARRIIDEISRPMVIDGSEVVVGASIGSARAPDDGATPDALLSNADIALYAAKADGRRGWRAFEPSMDTKIQIRRLIELELRAAVANDGIDVYFQPILDVQSRKVLSFEALARWRHPVRGVVSPSEFIPIVEDIGLMEEFGACVLRRACLACAAWPEDVSVSVNLSPSQFRSGRIEKTVLDALRRADLSPTRLDLEITESTLLDDRSNARGALEALRARGLRISLDDFGTGYSSLSYLLSFPLDRIKIDRSFTIGLGIQERASILVESVAAMSRRLGMSVLIEGVETKRQMRVIEALGTIAEVQGYLFSPPVPEAEATKLIGAIRRGQAAA